MVPDDLFDEEYGEHAATLWHLSDGDAANQGRSRGAAPDGRHEFGFIERPEPLGGPANAPMPVEHLYATTWDEETMLAKARRTSTGR